MRISWNYELKVFLEANIDSKGDEKMYDELRDIPNYKSWKVIEKVNKGWSKDSKFYIEDSRGNKFLVRISDRSNYGDKLEEFKFIKKCNRLSFSMSKAIEMGFCNKGNSVYMLLTWIEGNSLNEVLNDFTEIEQYKLGIEAGGKFEVNSFFEKC